MDTFRPFLGALLGGLAGFAFYRFIGCSSGTCPITGNPYIATLYGVFLGVLILSGGK